MKRRCASWWFGRKSTRPRWWLINLVERRRCCCGCAGESKTDPKDAFVLADVARAHPSRVVWLEPSSEALAHLELLCGYDADLRGDANRLTNRLRVLMLTHWPALERALGERLDSRGL